VSAENGADRVLADSCRSISILLLGRNSRRFAPGRDMGSFGVSEEAISALNHFFTELDGSLLLASDIVEHFEAKVVGVDKCLDEIRRIANKDLSPR